MNVNQTKSTHLNIRFYLILLLVIGFILRFSISFIHSYSSDELSAITRLKINGFSKILEQGVKTGDMHPAGVQLFEEFWSSLFGTSEMALRFPFVLMGIASIWLTYLIGKRTLNKKSGIIGATLLTVTYFPVLHSELARPYSPGLFFTLLVTIYWFKVLFPNKNTSKKWINSVVLGFCFALAMYTHYFAFMLVGFMGLTGLFFVSRKTFIPFLIAGIIGVLLFLPHYNITLYHLTIDGGLQWLEKPDKDWLLQFLFFVFNNSWTLLIAIIGFIFISIFKGEKLNNTQPKSVLIFSVWFFGIYVIGHVFSLMSSPILKFPVMLFPLPFLFLLIGNVLSKLPNQSFTITFFGILIIGSLSTIFEKDLFGNKHFGVFKELAQPMVKWRSTYGAENINTYMNVSNPDYLNFYATQMNDSLTFNRDVMDFNEDISIREELLNSDKPFCIVGYSARLTLPQIFETCKEFYPVILDYKKLNNCAVFLLAKDASLTPKTEQKSTQIAEFYGKKINTDWNYDTLQHSFDMHNRLIYYSDSTHIYGPDYSFKTQDLTVNYDYYLKITVNAKSNPNSQLTVSLTAKRNGEFVTNKNGENIWVGHDLETMLSQPENNNKSYFALKIPKQINPSDDIQISLWNRNGNPVKIYSIKIEAIENIWN